MELAEDLPTFIKSDAKRIKQVLFNLIGNASKFTYSGSITLSVSKKSNDMLLFKIVDTGIGMSESELTKLFKEFGKLSSSENRNKQGLGLGLSISMKIVKSLEGQIQVDSE